MNIDDKIIKEYFEQFVGEEPDNGTIVIYDDEDMKRFEEDMRKKWRTEHGEILSAWQKGLDAKAYQFNDDEECPDCKRARSND